MSCIVVLCYDDNNDIVNIFSDKYMELYNSVSYDTSEIKSIESFVLSRIFNSSCSDYIITVTDVMNAIAHLKSGKSNGSEGLFSDHLFNTSSVAPRHTQRITSQAHKTQTTNKRIKRSSVTNQYAIH